MDPHTLRIVHWNARGFRGRVTLLRQLLKEYEVDVALLNETLLSPSDRISFPGFYTYRLDDLEGLRARRGLAVLVSRRILHQQLPPQSLASIHALGVEVMLGPSRTHIYACYKPPGSRLVVSDIHRLLTEEPAVIAGDLNSKHPSWGSRVSNPDGLRLFADAARKGYNVVGAYVPTHYPENPHHTPDVLDVAITHRLPGLFQQDVLEEALGSDHLPLLATVTAIPVTTPPPPIRPARNWDVFSEQLHLNTPNFPVTSASHVEDMAQRITAAITSALVAASQTVSRRPVKRPPLPQHIADLIREKKRIRRIWQRSRCPTLKNEVNQLNSRIGEAIREQNTAIWTRRILQAGEDWPSMHRMCRSLTGAPSPVRPMFHQDGSIRYRAEDRAEIHAEHLQRQFSPFPTTATDHVAKITEEVRKFLDPSASPPDPPTFSVSPREVQKILARLKPRKAPGADGITNTALRHLPFRTVAALTRLFNGVLRTGHFPTSWKEGLVITIPKQHKDLRRPEGYRPITLLSTISKVFEIILLKHLSPFLPPRREQFGFRSELSTTLQLVRVVHHLSVAMNKHESSAVVFLDMEKAFDSVWHDGLLHKLIQANVPRFLVRVMASYLTGRTFRVKVDGALSDVRPITAGVPQGGVVSPQLYNLYASDVPSDPGTLTALYADDTAFLTSSMSLSHAAVKLQRTLDLLPEWLSKWRLSVNPGKSQALAVTRKRGFPPPLKLNDCPIPWANTAKYLGVIIDRRLTMHPQCKSAVAGSKAAAAQLRPIISAPQVPTKMRLALFKTYILSRLTYAAPAWYHLLAESHRKTIQRVQNRVVRRLVGAPRYVRNDTIYRDLRLESVEVFVRRTAANLFRRADASNLPELEDLAPWHARPPDYRLLPRDAALEEDDVQPRLPPRPRTTRRDGAM